MLDFPFLPPSLKFKSQLDQISNLAQVLVNLPSSPDQKQHLFHLQTLKSSLFSARIEGNTLTLETAKHIDLNSENEISRLEVSNLLKSQSIIKSLPATLTQKHLLDIHSLVMRGLSPQAGKLRAEESAIFDSRGNVIYLTPAVTEMKKMLRVLLSHLSPVESHPSFLIPIAACHYYFEKIHPFADGNGRTGRLILQYQLIKTNLFADFTLPLNEYLENNREAYYYYLEKNTRQIDGFISFFLDGIIWSILKISEDAKAISVQKEPVGLLPRRQEILNIITDHPYSSLDFIARRFVTIPYRTLSYDIKKLVDLGLIKKLGKTRGVVYAKA